MDSTSPSTRSGLGSGTCATEQTPWRMSSRLFTPNTTRLSARSRRTFWTCWTSSRVKTSWRRANKLHRLDAFRGPGDAWLLARIVVVASLVPLVMRLSLERVRELVEPRTPARPVARDEEQHVLDLVNLVLDGLKPVLRPNCQTRAITRYYFLRRAGLSLAIAFGIARSPKVVGHCWLVRDDQPYLEARDPRSVFIE